MKENIVENQLKLKSLQEALEKKLKKYQSINIISEGAKRLPNTTLFTVSGTDAQTKLIGFDLRYICVSSGSACSSGKISKSHVLTNMGLDEEEVKSSIRVSFGHNNTIDDIKAFMMAFKEVYNVA